MYIPKENLYFLIPTFSLTPKSTCYILNAQAGHQYGPVHALISITHFLFRHLYFYSSMTIDRASWMAQWLRVLYCSASCATRESIWSLLLCYRYVSPQVKKCLYVIEKNCNDWKVLQCVVYSTVWSRHTVVSSLSLYSTLQHSIVSTTGSRDTAVWSIVFYGYTSVRYCHVGMKDRETDAGKKLCFLLGPNYGVPCTGTGTKTQQTRNKKHGRNPKQKSEESLV